MRILIPAILFLAISCSSEPLSLEKEKQATQIIQTSDADIHAFMNAWHQAAAVADEDTFFGSIKSGGIYLGTDKTERWTKEVFEEWAAPHFAKDTAWAFTAHDRMIYRSDDGQTFWFEELLETWMGACRGSGVLVIEDEQLWIAHYDLSLMIDNDKMRKVIEATQESE